MSDLKIVNGIKQAQMAAMISGIMTLGGSVTLIMGHIGGTMPLVSILSLIDVIFIFSMAYGIYKKNRACAVLMFEYFLLSIIFRMLISEQFNAGAFIVGWIFLYFFYHGISASYAYHKCNACEGKVNTNKPSGWIVAGSSGMLVYFIVLPGLILQV